MHYIIDCITKSRETFSKCATCSLFTKLCRKMQLLMISLSSLINYTMILPSHFIFVVLSDDVEQMNGKDVMLFTFSINFFSSPHAYDVIIKLNTEHLTCHPSSFRFFANVIVANRNINIHSCIQWTWILLMLYEVNNFDSSHSYFCILQFIPQMKFSLLYTFCHLNSTVVIAKSTI